MIPSAAIPNPFDPDSLRLSVNDFPNGQPKRSAKKLPRHRKGEQFLKGPIPWPWLQRAMTLPGKALHVALLLWQKAGLHRKGTIRFNLSATDKIGIHRDTTRRGLRALESAGLIAVTRLPGQALEVTLLDVKPKNSE